MNATAPHKKGFLMPKFATIKQPESLAKMAYEAIRQSILYGEWKLGEIYNENPEAKGLVTFTSTSISDGIRQFCLNFDYISQRPTKFGNRNDLDSWINRLLRMRVLTFTIEHLNETFLQKNPTSYKHIETLMKLGLVEENLVRSPNNLVQYDVIDPRIKHLIKIGILNINER